MAANSSLQNLDVDIQGATEGGKPGGDPLNRVITIRNQGDRFAEIEVWLEPTDMRSEPLRQWSTFDKSDADLALQAQESIDVVLSFLVPLQADPGFYGYDVRVRSPQYPGEDIRRSQQLQVLVSDQSVLPTEPKITLLPKTDSLAPFLLKPGTDMTLIISVENPSRRTDRFFLSCPDLSSDWFTVTYPEKSGNGSALVEQTDGLQLNPKEFGQIQLKIHPPQHAPAGDYFPTVRLTSSNRSDLVILEIVYLTIPMDDRLIAELVPPNRTIPAEDEYFQLRLTNPGNIDREIAIAAADPERVFTYVIEPDLLAMLPGETAEAIVHPRPRHRWRQLWRLREQTIAFSLEIQNVLIESPQSRTIPPQEIHPEIPPALQPALPSKVPGGKITWKAKRRWLFRLLLFLIGLGLFTTLAVLLWYFLLWRPSLRPRIAEFSMSQEDYQEGTDAVVTVDWQVTNLESIGKLHLIHPSQENLLPDVPNDSNGANSEASLKEYFFNKMPASGSPEALIPPELQPFCTSEAASQTNSILNTLLGMNRRLMGRPENTQTLACTGVPVEDFQVREGSYDFQLLVFPMRDEEISSSLSDREKVTDVAIAPLPPPPPPAITELTATATEYALLTSDTLPAPVSATPDAGNNPDSLVSASSEAAANGEQSPSANEQTDTSITESGGSAIDEERPAAPILLNWTISNFEDIQSLKLVSLAPDGSEHELPQVFDFAPETADGSDTSRIPVQLLPFCTVEENILICERVLTSAVDVGEYVFYLTVTPKRNPSQAEIVESTATIPIKPPMPEIVSFALNGEEGALRPKHVFTINPARGSIDVILTWQVENATEVELMPAPGVIEGNSLTYTVSAAPGSETVTLRAVNELGEEVTRAIVIEKVGFDPAQPVSPAAANAEAGGVLPPPPTVPVPTVPIPSSIPRRLPPAEEAPRAN